MLYGGQTKTIMVGVTPEDILAENSLIHIVKKSNRDENENLYVIDIHQTCFNKTLSPEQFINDVTDEQLIHSVKHIYLVVSETLSDFNLTAFSQRVAAYFLKKYQRQISVHNAISLNFDRTILSPPNEGGNWVVYGMDEASPNQTIFWSGHNVLDLLDKPQQTFNGKEYVWG